MLKWALRIGGGLLALVGVVLIVFVGSYAFWMSDHKRELREGSQIASTPLGDIEYAVAGEGQPRLMLHGTPGGYDQTIAAPRLRPEVYAGVQTISVSRPGYLRTPLSSGENPQAQADLYAALLDELHIERAIVIAASGGAPSGMQMAIRHPEKVEALILLVPLLGRLERPADQSRPSYSQLLTHNMAMFAANAAANSGLIGPSLVPGMDPRDPTQRGQISAILRSMAPAGPRMTGQFNDIEDFDQLDVDAWPLEFVSVPTLIISGNADSLYQDTARAAARMPRAQLVTIEGGGHMVSLTHAAEFNQHMDRFLETLAQQTASAPR